MSSHLRKAALLLLTLGVSLSGCTRGSSPSASVRVGDGKGAFAFDSSHVTELTIAKADPLTGDHWLARVERQQEKPSDFYENDPWIIRSYSENAALQDHLANRGYILHLVDTLSTFHATAAVKTESDTEAVRSSYGLDPPRYALEWKAYDPQTQSSNSYRIEIGSLVDPAHPSSKESYGSFPPDRPIYKVDGAAIAMLDYLSSFTILRQEVLSPMASDDVDEIEIYHGKRKVFYGQREGDAWTNEAHRRWKKDVSGFLDRITHLRVEKFLDNETEARPARAVLERKPLERIVLKDRHGNATEFLFARTHGQELAKVSTRGSAVFQLYPSALSKLEP